VSSQQGGTLHDQDGRNATANDGGLLGHRGFNPTFYLRRDQQ
jgi:membrane-bound metal-dependent hydrolase YbcI (DUF457 family)